MAARRTSIDSLLATFEARYEEAKAANLGRYEEAMRLYDEMIEQYKPGGGFGAGYEAELEQAKKVDTGAAMQHQISSGLFGVQSTGGLSRRWEAEVGSPARLRLEDLRMGRYGEAMASKAGVIERREDEYPDYGAISQMIMAASQGGVSGGGRVYRGSSGSLTSLPGRSGPTRLTPTARPATTQYGELMGGGVADIQSGVPYGPTFESKAKMAETAERVRKAAIYEQTTPVARKAKITSNLKKMYPQMYQPGWGKTTTDTRTPTRKLGYSPYGAGGF